MAYKKIFCSFALIILFVLICSSCSSGVDQKSDVQDLKNVNAEPSYEWGKVKNQTITIWGDKADLERPYNANEFIRYEALTGNKIKTIAMSKEDLNTKVPQVFSSINAEQPDILLSYGGTNIENLNPENNFYDFTNAEWVNDLTDTALNQSIFNGKVMGLPHGEASVSGMLYNKEIFERYNLNVPQTQAEFLDVCEKLLQKGIQPLYLPYAEITMLLYQFPMDSFLVETDVLDKLNSGELSYANIPEMKKIVKWYKDMSDRGYFGVDYEKNDWDGMNDAMKNGQYAMMICWDTWLYTSFDGDASKFGIMPAFMGVPDSGCFEGANNILFLANKNSPNVEASLDLITFLADPYNYNIAFEGIYTAPVFNNQIGSITTPQYMEKERLIEKLFFDSTAWSRVRGFAQYDAIFIQEYMQGDVDLETCLNKMDISRRNRAGMH